MRAVLFAAVLLAGCGDGRKKFESQADLPPRPGSTTQPTSPPEKEPAKKVEPIKKVEPDTSKSKMPDVRVVTYTPLGEWSQIGDVRVRIDSAKVGKVKYKNQFANDLTSETDDEYLAVTLTVDNVSKVKKLEYGRPRDSAGLTDEHENKYRRGPFSATETINGRAGYATIYPGKPPVTDVLCFQTPVDAATKLFLTINPHWVAGNEPFRFVIPASAWK